MCEFFKTFQEEKFTESVKKVSFNYIYVFLQLMCFSGLIKRLVDVQVRFFFKVHFRCLKKKKHGIRIHITIVVFYWASLLILL